MVIRSGAISGGNSYVAFCLPTYAVYRDFLQRCAGPTRFTSASVLLIGESGTGKELIARLIHELDPRASTNELVILDCTTIVPELSGSEFFGHERGAFTGADRAYDSDPLDAELRKDGIEMIAPHRGNRSKPPTQDRRRLSRYMRRWLVERFFAWIQWQRRILIRWEYHAHNFLGFVQLACLVILFKRF
jgi:transposase